MPYTTGKDPLTDLVYHLITGEPAQGYSGEGIQKVVDDADAAIPDPNLQVPNTGAPNPIPYVAAAPPPQFTPVPAGSPVDLSAASSQDIEAPQTAYGDGAVLGRRKP